MARGVGSGRVGQAMDVVRQWRHCAAIAFGWWFACAAVRGQGEGRPAQVAWDSAVL
jgi:hypothetical protein